MSQNYIARAETIRAIREGVLTRQPCETCSAEPTEAHHDDYEKPLDVRWLCKSCHRAWHKEHGRSPKEGLRARGGEDYLSVAEAATFLGVSRARAYQLVQQGKLIAEKRLGFRYISREALEIRKATKRGGRLENKGTL